MCIRDRRKEDAILEQIREKTKVDLSQELIEQAERTVFMETEAQLKKQNTGLEEWLTKRKKSIEDFQKELKEQATRRLTLRFGVEALIEERKIEVTDDEMKTIIDGALRGVEPSKHAEVSNQYAKGTEGYEQLRWQRTVEKLMEQLIAQ